MNGSEAFLLSESEVYTNHAKGYGFVPDYGVYDEACRAKSTVYAKALGTVCSDGKVDGSGSGEEIDNSGVTQIEDESTNGIKNISVSKCVIRNTLSEPSAMKKVKIQKVDIGVYILYYVCIFWSCNIIQYK